MGATETMAGDDGADSADELWAPRRAADYLNAGSVDLHLTPRNVSELMQRGDLRGMRASMGGWRRALASDVRRLRAERLRALGVEDPDYPLPPPDSA